MEELPPIQCLNIEAVISFGSFETMYQNTRLQIPKDYNYYRSRTCILPESMSILTAVRVSILAFGKVPLTSILFLATAQTLT